MDYLPFNSVNHDRVYKAEDWAWYFSTFISNGVFPSPADGLQVLATDGMTVAVQPGYGFINGYAFRNQSAYNIQIETADGALSRIDRVVLRWDLVNRQMLLAVLTGTASANPTAPTLTQNADIWEIALADVAVTKGLTTITQAQITDDRFNSSLCGICAGIIDQIDASTLTKQFEAYYAAFKAGNEKDFSDWSADQKADMESYQAEEKAAFHAWYELIKGNLSEDSAGNLQLQVNDLKDSAAPISQKKTTVYDGNTVTTTFADGRKIVTTYNGDTVIKKMYSSANVLQWTKTTVYNGDTVTETIEEVK